jgi:lipoate-protein ligase A
MERNRAAVEQLLRGAGPLLPAQPSPPSAANRQPPVEVQGQTDLAIGGRKISGNAQRRKRRAILFHGTFLLRFDLPMMEGFLPLPSRQPEYRRDRPHQDFLANLAVTPESLKLALRQAWGAFEPVDPPPRGTITLLAREKYETNAWNLKFP